MSKNDALLRHHLEKLVVMMTRQPVDRLITGLIDQKRAKLKMGKNCFGVELLRKP